KYESDSRWDSIAKTPPVRNRGGHRTRPGALAHCTCPRGREAAIASAHSTAVVADSLRLSKAIQSHAEFAFETSGVTDTRISPCPAALTLLGASCDPGTSKTCSPASAFVSS